MMIESNPPMLQTHSEIADGILECLPKYYDTFNMTPDENQPEEDFREDVDSLIALTFPAKGIQELSNGWLGSHRNEGRWIRYKVRDEGYLELILLPGRAFFCKLHEQQARTEENPAEAVLRFINAFTGNGKRDQVIECYTTGCCYYFAKSLELRFGGKIMYSLQDNHFACGIGGQVYDITGIVTDKHEWLDWAEYDKTDPSHVKHITNDCIMF